MPIPAILKNAYSRFSSKEKRPHPPSTFIPPNSSAATANAMASLVRFFPAQRNSSVKIGASHAQSLMLLSRISAKIATPFIQRLFPCSSTQRIPKQIQRVNSMFNPQNFSVSVSENAKSYGSWEIPANNSKRKK